MSIDRYDLLSFGGLAMVGVGLWMWSPALALVVCGAAIAGLGIFGSINAGIERARSRGDKQGGGN